MTRSQSKSASVRPWVVRNRDTFEPVATYATREEADSHAARFPNDFVKFEPAGDCRQGKCTTCKVRHEWPARLTKLADAKCPGCGAPLKRTTWSVQLPVQQWPRGLGVP